MFLNLGVEAHLFAEPGFQLADLGLVTVFLGADQFPVMLMRQPIAARRRE